MAFDMVAGEGGQVEDWVACGVACFYKGCCGLDTSVVI
jgi:hypothetical protein